MGKTVQYDVWAVTPEGNDAYFYASATIASSGSITLLKENLGYNGTGYKVAITSNGADGNKNFTITGTRVGGVGFDAGPRSEVLVGPSASVVYSANYYTSVQSIRIDAASTGGVKIGFGGDLAFPRARIKGVIYLAGATTGSVTFTSQPSNTVVLKLPTPPSATAHQDVLIPGEGVLTVKGGKDDFAVMSWSQVATSNITIFCG